MDLPKKNDTIQLKIEDIGVDGAGIGKYEGVTFFVKDAVIGDVVEARVVKMKKTYGYARMERILSASRHRVPPLCEVHRQCGGCQIQTMDYAEQLRYKQEKVRGNLIRIGGFPEEEIDAVLEPIVGMEHPFRYRNKAQYPIGTDRNGNPVAGFYASRTHSLIPVADCKLGIESNRRILACVLSYMREHQVPAYEESSDTGVVRHVLIRSGFATGELMVCIVIRTAELPHREKLIEKLRQIDGMTSISVNYNFRRTNVILGEKTETIWGKDVITDVIYVRESDGQGQLARTRTSVAYQISPQSFYQVNPVQTEKLYSLALEYAGLTGRETVWDLYCGIGTISLFLAQRAGKVYGVEVVPQAVLDARRNAALNKITNAEFIAGKAEEVLPEFYGRQGKGGGDADMLHPDVIVVDPPRKGCDIKCLGTILQMQPERIVYVSCDPATLARDLKVLCDGGYALRRVRPVDQFGQTVHVETIVGLRRQDM